MPVRTITCFGVFLMVFPAALNAGEQTFGNWTVTITPNGSSQPIVQQASHSRLPRTENLVRLAVQSRPLDSDFDAAPDFDAPPSFDAPHNKGTNREETETEENPPRPPALPEPAGDFADPAPSQAPRPSPEFVPNPDASPNPIDTAPRDENPLIVPEVLVPPAPEPVANNAEPLANTVEIAPCAPNSTADLVKLYRSVYDAIPFSRAEYDANPTYRHDSTMEFLFGQMRPTVLQRGTMRVNVQLPPVAVEPIPYNRYGMNSGYFPFYAGGLRVHRSW